MDYRMLARRFEAVLSTSFIGFASTCRAIVHSSLPSLALLCIALLQDAAARDRPRTVQL